MENCPSIPAHLQLAIIISAAYFAIGAIISFVYIKIVDRIIDKRIDRGEIKYLPHEAVSGIDAGVMIFIWPIYFPWNLATNFRYWRKGKWGLDYLEEEEKKKK